MDASTAITGSANATGGVITSNQNVKKGSNKDTTLPKVRFMCLILQENDLTASTDIIQVSDRKN